MYVAEIPNRNSPPTFLLREDRRHGSKVVKRTLSNITHWPRPRIKALRLLLKGEDMVPARSHFKVIETLPHGHVEVVLGMIRKLRVDSLISSRPCPERNIILAALAQSILHPGSKLALTRLWHTSTLAEELGVVDCTAEDVYEALDWLLERQAKIEKKLAKRHLEHGALALYDLSSCSYYGRTCPLARIGNNRDKKRGVACIAFGVLTDEVGRPVAIQVYPGNTGDPSTVPDQVQKLRKEFKLDRVALVGDRGMLTHTQISTLKRHPTLGWISALRSTDIRKLVEQGSLQMSLFDEQNLAEISSPDFPGERLIACMNPLLAAERKRKHNELLDATEKQLVRIRKEVDRRTKRPLSAGEIGEKVGRAINRYKMRKHFELTMKDNLLKWERRLDSIRKEECLDGVYIIRTSTPLADISPEDAVRKYKSLTRVERIFLRLKSLLDLTGPVRHRIPDRVRAHFLLSKLVYYVTWHLEEALAPLLFVDEELPFNRKTRDPVAPAEPSVSAKVKKHDRVTSDNLTVQSMETLLQAMSLRSRNTCQVIGDTSGPTFQEVTEASRLQQRVFDLLEIKPQ